VEKTNFLKLAVRSVLLQTTGQHPISHLETQKKSWSHF